MRTTDVAAWAARAVDAGMTEQLEEWSRWALLDTLSVLLAGHRTGTARAAAKTAGRSPGTGSVSGRGISATPAMAAFTDAVAANALDFDDGHHFGGGIHAGSTVVPVLLALAEESTTVARLRAAMVVGYEIAIRAGYLLSPEHSGQHYRASGHAACLGAAAAGAAMLGLGAERIAGAIRIAASHAPVSTAHSAGACESIGWAAATAVTSVLLAEDGFSDEEADARLVPPVSPTPFDQRDPVPFLDSLGTAYESVNCYVKPYACCRAIHAALDALAAMRDSISLDPAHLEEIVVRTAAAGATMTDRRPLTLEQAQFSIPAVVATYLHCGLLGPVEMLSARFRDQAVLSLADRVRIEHDHDLDRVGHGSYPATVEVRSGGRFATSSVFDPWGAPANPLPAERRLAKAKGCLALVLPPERADRLVELVLGHSADRKPTVARLRASMGFPTAG